MVYYTLKVPPTFTHFPPVLGKFTCFLHTLRVFFPPYFYHDAFMHHPMHVLDASADLRDYFADSYTTCLTAVNFKFLFLQLGLNSEL